MATSAGLTFSRGIIPLVSNLTDDDYKYTTLSRTVGVGDNAEKRKYELPILDDVEPGKVEYLLRVINEFRDVISPKRLNLTAGTLLIAYFRQLLGGVIRDEFDVLRAANPVSAAGFRASNDALIAHFIRPTDLAYQRRYLETIKKH